MATSSPTSPPTNPAGMESTSADEVSSTVPIIASSTAVPGKPSAAPAQDEPSRATIETSTSTLPNTPESAATVPAKTPSEPEPELKAPASPSAISPTPVASLTITVLVQSGAKHQFTLDQGYLERHQVKSTSGKDSLTDPFSMTVWQLKECVWKDWREDWDQRPASALFIKLIQFGAYLTDNHLLRDCRLSVDGPNVIHMAIRPAEVGDDDATQRSTKGAFGGSRDREGATRTPSCRCVIL